MGNKIWFSKRILGEIRIGNTTKLTIMAKQYLKIAVI